jgi:hypothetical protein
LLPLMFLPLLPQALVFRYLLPQALVFHHLLLVLLHLLDLLVLPQLLVQAVLLSGMIVLLLQVQHQHPALLLQLDRYRKVRLLFSMHYLICLL